MIPSNPLALECISLALFQNLDPKRLFVILTIYIDESGTHGAPIMIMGGLVGRLGQWVDFDKKWLRVLKREGLTHFHGKDVLHRSGELRGWGVDRRDKFVDKMAAITEKNVLFGFSIKLDQKTYKETYIKDRSGRIHFDSAYGLCLRSALQWLPQWIQEVVKKDDLELNFVLEEGHINAGDATRIFNEIKKFGPIEIRRLLGTLSFGAKVKVRPLQGADSVSYVAFRQETKNAPAIERSEGATFSEDRRQIKSRAPIYRCEVNKKYMEDFRSASERSKRVRKSYPSS